MELNILLSLFVPACLGLLVLIAYGIFDRLGTVIGELRSLRAGIPYEAPKPR